MGREGAVGVGGVRTEDVGAVSVGARIIEQIYYSMKYLCLFEY